MDQSNKQKRKDKFSTHINNLMQYKKPMAMISDFNWRDDNTQKKKAAPRGAAIEIRYIVKLLLTETSCHASILVL